MTNLKSNIEIDPKTEFRRTLKKIEERQAFLEKLKVASLGETFEYRREHLDPLMEQTKAQMKALDSEARLYASQVARTNRMIMEGLDK